MGQTTSVNGVFYSYERVCECCALTAVTGCIFATVIFMLGMGIGIGYNYCFVELTTKTNFSCPPCETTTVNLETTTITTEPTIEWLKKPSRAALRSENIRSFYGYPKHLYQPTMPLAKDIRPLDMSMLLAKLLKNHKNVTLELVART